MYSCLKETCGTLANYSFAKLLRNVFFNSKVRTKNGFINKIEESKRILEQTKMIQRLILVGITVKIGFLSHKTFFYFYKCSETTFPPKYTINCCFEIFLLWSLKKTHEA
jgi:hypothetical protein